ncbi:hypothetical protein GCK32_019414, partial [Trichostrongylus colubriformis]
PVSVDPRPQDPRWQDPRMRPAPQRSHVLPTHYYTTTTRAPTTPDSSENVGMFVIFHLIAVSHVSCSPFSDFVIQPIGVQR